MNGMCAISIGEQDFKEMRASNAYFMDKSMLIDSIIARNCRGTFLFTRPRRFGKSLNLSMIDAFFNVKYKGNTWFNNLKILERSENRELMNKFPIISIDLSLSECADIVQFREEFNMRIWNLADRYQFLRTSEALDAEDIDMFLKFRSRNLTESESKYAISNLAAMLSKHYSEKVIILVDEYDKTLNACSDPSLRAQILSFLKGVLAPLLKGNDDVKFAVVTGVMQITKESMFSGLNNLYVDNIIKTQTGEMFGFTTDEVEKMCDYYGHPEKFEEAKEWYDGYRFGNTDIYNPWSIINYIHYNFEPDTYWANTANTEAVRNVLSHADSDVLNDLIRLGEGKSVIRPVKADVTFGDMSGGTDAVYSILAMTGYLKAVPIGDGLCSISIPNREMYKEFGRVVMGLATGNVNSRAIQFKNGILSGDAELVRSILRELLFNVASSRIFTDEHAYQAFVAGILMTACGEYSVTADFERGKGYYDLLLKRERGIGPNVVIEFKKSVKEADLKSDAEKAMEQIRDREYTHGLTGTTILYGISMFGKEPFVTVKSCR